MGRVSICEKTGMKRGTWTAEEDMLLSGYIRRYGNWNWREVPKFAGLSRCGKSCRLRWMNYLRPNIRRGNYTREEEQLILDLHDKLGNRWSKIAASLPGRTDNEIKNYWHTHLKKRSQRSTKPKEAKEKHVSLSNSFRSDNITPLILESSAVSWEMSPPKSHDFSSSSVDDEAVVMQVEATNDSATSLESCLEHEGSFWNDDPFSMESRPYPVPPLESDDFTSFMIDDDVVTMNNQLTDEVVIMNNYQVTDESAIPSEPNLGFDGNFWTEPFLGGYTPEDIASVLLDPMSPQKSDGFSSFIMDEEAFLLDQVTDEGAKSSHLNLEFDENFLTELLMADYMPEDITSVLSNPSLPSPLEEALHPYGSYNDHGRNSFF